jgi:MFS family permease
LASANFVLFTARGMVLPFLVIFFGQVVGLGEALVGAGLAVAAVCGVAFTLLLAGTIDRFGARPVLVTTVIGLALAYLAFPWGTTPDRFLALMVVFGLFGNLYWPASDTLATSFLPRARAGEVFALLRVANAAGIGAGGLIGGLLVSGGGVPEYRRLFVLSGILLLAAAGLILALVPSPRLIPRRDVAIASGLFGWSAVLRDRWFLLSQVVLFVLVTAFTQLQVSVPAYLWASAGVTEGTIGALFAVNTLIVIAAQVPVGRALAGRRYGATFALAGLLWALSYAGFALSPWSDALPFLAIVVYTLAELLFMPASGAIIVDLAPEHARGRYLSFSSVVWGLSWGASSLVAGFALESARPILLWPGLIVVLLTGAAVSLLLDRRPQRSSGTLVRQESFSRLEGTAAGPVRTRSGYNDRAEEHGRGRSGGAA